MKLAQLHLTTTRNVELAQKLLVLADSLTPPMTDDDLYSHTDTVLSALYQVMMDIRKIKNF